MGGAACSAKIETMAFRPSSLAIISWTRSRFAGTSLFQNRRMSPCDAKLPFHRIDPRCASAREGGQTRAEEAIR
jgi:hypothetical protein